MIPGLFWINHCQYWNLKIILFDVSEYKKLPAFTIGFVLVPDTFEKLSLDFIIVGRVKLSTCIVNKESVTMRGKLEVLEC